MVLLASDFDKSNYFRAEDIKQDRKLRIKAVTQEIFERDGGKEKKLVLWFTNADQGLVLNKTNIRTLKGAYNDDTTDWIGKVIVVFPVMAEFRGKMTPALRVRIPPPKQATTEVATAPSPAPSGNGAAVTAAADPELQPDPKKPLKADLDDEIMF